MYSHQKRHSSKGIRRSDRGHILRKQGGSPQPQRHSKHRLALSTHAPHTEEFRARKRASKASRRLKVLQHYSGNEVPVCAYCGEKTLEFLTIDHIDGNGLRHRREIGRGGQGLYDWLLVNKFPDGFRVLCYNCNSSLGHYGYCPHFHQHKDVNKNVA